MPDDVSKATDIYEKLDRLRNIYLARLPPELAKLKALAANLNCDKPNRELLSKLHHCLHHLAGSGGIFGFRALSARARILERQVNEWLAGSLDDVDIDTCQTFAEDVTRLSETKINAPIPETSISPSNSR